MDIVAAAILCLDVEVSLEILLSSLLSFVLLADLLIEYILIVC